MMQDVEYDVDPARILTILFCCSRPAVTWEETERRQLDPSLPKRVCLSLSLLLRARAPSSVLVRASWFIYLSSKSKESSSF